MLIGSIVQLSNTNLFIFTPAFLDILQSGYKQARTLWIMAAAAGAPIYIYSWDTRYSAHPSVVLLTVAMVNPATFSVADTRRIHHLA